MERFSRPYSISINYESESAVSSVSSRPFDLKLHDLSPVNDLCPDHSSISLVINSSQQALLRATALVSGLPISRYIP